MSEIRKPAVAGTFYPGDKSELISVVSKLLDESENPKQFDDIFGLAVPHAGYLYSGRTAAAAYKHIEGKKYSKVIIIAPSHREYFTGITVYPGDAYNTPLGDIKIDNELRRKLLASSYQIKAAYNGHKLEHSLEVQLPFLQLILNDFTLLPIIIGDQGRGFVFDLAESLAEIIEDDTLIIASTDLSHFHSREKAQQLDTIVTEHVKEFQYERLQHLLELNACEACGGGCLVTLLKAAELKGYNKTEILKYSDSGDITGDTSEVVGYFSALVYR